MKSTHTMIALTVTGLLAIAGSTTRAQDASVTNALGTEDRLRAPARPPRPQRPSLPKSVTPLSEGSTPNAGLASTSVFSPGALSSAPATGLIPPLILNYSGNAPALLIDISGPNKGLESVITDSKSVSSAVYGQTIGAGAGVTGYNNGAVGPAGKFDITNPGSSQPAVYATTNGLGSAIFATNLTTNANGTNNAPTLYAENMNPGSHAVGVFGMGNTIGVQGMTAPNDNIESIGMYGIATIGTGVNAYSFSGTGAAIFSQQGTGADVESDAGYAIYTQSAGAATIYAYNNGPKGVGLYAESEFGLAGQFQGDVHVAGKLMVGSTSYSSDKRLKQDMQPVDGSGVLEKIEHLAVTSWDYKTDPMRRHVGPMAQDFHAAFGLNGDDETHINEVDIAGVSLAAIKELISQMKSRDAQIADLKSQLTAQGRATADMQAMMSVVTSQLAVLSKHQAVGTRTAALGVQDTRRNE